MKLPKLATTIERRIFLTYAVEPELIASQLPDGIKPKLFNGKASAGVCLIRMGNIRPAFVKPEVGITAENAGHRIAATYTNAAGEEVDGVYAPFRHTSSRLAVAMSGTLFPGIQRPATFTSLEANGNFKVNMNSKDTLVNVDVDLVDESEWKSELFPTFAEASEAYRNGKVALSPVGSKGNLKTEPLKLEHVYWDIKPAHINYAFASSFALYPKESISLDHALVMQNVPAYWSNED